MKKKRVIYPQGLRRLRLGWLLFLLMRKPFAEGNHIRKQIFAEPPEKVFRC